MTERYFDDYEVHKPEDATENLEYSELASRIWSNGCNGRWEKDDYSDGYFDLYTEDDLRHIRHIVINYIIQNGNHPEDYENELNDLSKENMIWQLHEVYRYEYISSEQEKTIIKLCGKSNRWDE